MASTTVRIPYPRRRWPVFAIGVVVAAFLLLTFLSNFYVDVLWYREVDLSQVFWTRIWAQAGLASAFFVTFFALLLVNLYVTRRLAPTIVALTPEQEIVERFKENVEPYLRWAIPLGAALLSIFVGLAAAGHWQEFLLWRSSGGIAFGNPDEVFGRDPAFYVFTLPWLKYLQSWLFAALVGVTVISGIGHFLQGGIRPQAVGLRDKVDPQVRAHLSVLLGLILLAKAWGYYLGRFDLLTSDRGVVQGASYTDVNAQLPALTFLAIVAVICAVMFFVNARYRVWSLPIIAVGLLLIVSILLGTAYPAFIQTFRVKPNEQQYEKDFIGRNIAGTRRAFGLDEIRLEERPFQPVVTAEDVEANQATIANIRLWRPSVLKENFESVQRIRQYYDFNDVDVDRYEIDGERRVLMVSGREVTQDGISEQARTWQNQHLVYTHGFGTVAAQVNSTTTDGGPLLTLEDIPPEGEPSTAQPRIYYGEFNEVDFVVVNSTTAELDYEGASGETPFTYDGEGGIELGGFFRRALFAWRFQDANLMISGQVQSDSRILIRRDIVERAEDTMPFLTFDADPYLAVTSEGYVWIMDAYTTSDGYPYSQAVNLADVTADLLPRQEVNYIRNSVKAVVDAYDGSVTYYADLDEPIMQAWNLAFPGVFTSHRRRSGGAPGPFPLSGEPLPGPGLPVRQLSRPGPGGVLSEAGLLGSAERPHAPQRIGRDRRLPVSGPRLECQEAAPELSAPPAARGNRGAVPSHDPVPTREPAQHGRVDGGELRSRRLRGARGVHPPGRAGRGRSRPRLRPHELGPGVLGGANAPGHGRVGGPLRRPADDPDRGVDPLRGAGLRAGRG